MSRSYSPSSYDDHFCLKPPALLWIAVLFLCRAIVLIVLYDLAHVSGMSSDVAALLQGTESAYALIPSLVAAPVLYALLRRAPTSTKLVRWIWAHGRVILVVAAILDCAVSVAGSGILEGQSADSAASALLAALFDVYFLLYILAAPRVRDSFADFPPPQTARRRSR